MTVAGPLVLTACGSPEQYNPPWLQQQHTGGASAPQPAPAAPVKKPVQTASTPVAPQPVSQTAEAPAQARTVTVGKNETLAAVVRRTDVPGKFLIRENGLKEPYTLTEGQVLKVPAIRSHTVVSGETLTGISNRYGVDMTQLARINDIPAPYGVQVGQVLGIPQNEPKQPLPAAAQTMVPEGQKMAAATPEPQHTAPAPSSSSSQPPAADPQTPPQPQAAPPAPSAPPSSAASVPGKSDLSVEPPKRAGSLFAWPLKGKVLTGYGVDAAGLRNDGINIQASPGASVRAAENGVVVYAGNELKGFGNLLLIKHADGWMTAYAHNAELAVLRGDVVKKGQVIAKAGATGSVTSPQVHFEVRKDGSAVDPIQYMEKR